MTTNQNPLPWRALGIDLSPLVSNAYVEYLPLIEDALVFFLASLSPRRVAEILADQQALPPSASMAQRLATLMIRCPTLHKLGQVVARHRGLDPSLRRQLQALESMEARTPISRIEAMIKHELSDLVGSKLQLGPQALAEASVAVVIPFSVNGKGMEEPGVLKVLKPGIVERLEEELEIWSALGDFIDERCAHYALPSFSYSDTVETVKRLLLNEVRLDREQKNLASAAEFFRNNRSVQIPSVLPFSTARITAMERISGTKVTEAEHLHEGLRQKLAGSIVESLVAQPIWSRDPRAIFHADPHAGNLFLTEDGRLAILDWSLVGQLSKAERVQIMQIVLGVLGLDVSRIVRALAALACATPNEPALRRVVEKAVGALSWSKLPGFHWLLNLLDEAMLTGGLRFGEDLLLLRKSILTLEGVVADVSAQSSLDAVLPGSAIQQLCREWGYRACALPTSRDFGTQLSNLDLLSLFWLAPAGTAQFWMNSIFQALEQLARQSLR